MGAPAQEAYLLGAHVGRSRVLMPFPIADRQLLSSLIDHMIYRQIAAGFQIDEPEDMAVLTVGRASRTPLPPA